MKETSGILSDRIKHVPRSFIREILKVARDPSIISFAGGLPNEQLFPLKQIEQATKDVFADHGTEILQYSNSEGYLPLRQLISASYARRQGLNVPPENILITNGSQQGLDLLGKVLVNQNDAIVVEEPGYLGAIQALSLYSSRFIPVPVHPAGMDIEILATTLEQRVPKLVYAVPNFQNPSGISYSAENRSAVAELLRGTQCLLVEDDPYGELRFSGEEKPSFYKLAPKNTVLLGSYSKTVAPSFRLGWIVAPDWLMEKLIIAKQAADLHTNGFVQHILHRYLSTSDIKAQIDKISKFYGDQKKLMMASISCHFPSAVEVTDPEGGMFLWATLPESLSSVDLFNRAIHEKVAFVPGDPFYINKVHTNTFRLNFSCVGGESIENGITRLGCLIKSCL